MGEELARAHQDRSVSRERSFIDRAVSRTYSHEDYEMTARDGTSRGSSPCRACQYEGHLKGDDRASQDS